MNIETYTSSEFFGKVKEMVKQVEALRKDANDPQDISLATYLEESQEGLEFDAFLEKLGIDPRVDTISNIFTQPADEDVRWLVPEIIREAIRVGLREAPIWPNLVAAEQDISQQQVTMPFINMSDAVPHKVGEGETIPLGTISYGQKKVNTFKIGRGISLTDEVKNYVSLDVVGIFFQDFGIKLGMAMDSLAIDTILNGDMANGAEAAPVVGVTTVNSKVYRDFLKVWVRGSRMGRKYNTIIGGETSAIETLDLPEFKDKHSGTTQANLNLKTPVPKDANYFIHGNVPPNQEILLDSRYALIKFSVIPLKLESDRIVSNQTEEFYATMTLGFGKLFKDSAVVLDKSLAFSAHGFPEFMDVDAFMDVEFGS